MIIAEFYTDNTDRLVGFRVTGHAGLADRGEDVCCASVSSAVMMAANTLTEAFKIKAKVTVEENDIKLMLGDSTEDKRSDCDKVLLGLMTHLYCLTEEFVGHIRVTTKAIRL